MISAGSATPSRTVTDGAVAAKSASDTDCQQPPQHQQPQPINPMFLLSGLQPQVCGSVICVKKKKCCTH